MKYLNKLNKNNPILWYLFFLIIISQTAWAKAVVFLAIPLLIHLELHKLRTDLFAAKKTLFLNLILFIGFFSGFFHLFEYDLYYFGRDIIYFIQAPIFILMGIFLCKELGDYKELIKVIVLSSISITLYKLIQLFINPNLFFKLGLEIRYDHDFSNSTALLVFTILFYARKYKIKLFENFVEWLMMIVSLFSILISFSRTFYILLLIVFLITYVKNHRSILIIYWSTVFCVSFIIFGSLFVNLKSQSSQGSTFQSKISHSLNEIIVRDYKSSFEIIHSWRGHEAFLGISKFYKGNFLEILFGQGFGTVVYTPKWIFGTEDNNLGVLPIFHNGYITILLKTGLVGLLLFFFFLYKLLKISSKIPFEKLNNQQKFTTFLFRLVLFTILISTLVVHGIFTTASPFILILLLGASIKMNILQNRFLIKNSLVR